MPDMYDSVNVEAIPADATEILAYTDGDYANVDKVKARFPGARIHTISAVGQVVAEWIDVEPGCVWPPNRAVDLWHSWRRSGCKGFYSAQSTQQQLREALTAGDTPEWFDADWNNVDHVDAGDVATQFESLPGYDISETTPAFEGDPAPTPPPPPKENNDMPILVSDGNAIWLVASDLSRKHHVGTPDEGSDYAKAINQPVVPTDASLIQAIQVSL